MESTRASAPEVCLPGNSHERPRVPAGYSMVSLAKRSPRSFLAPRTAGLSCSPVNREAGSPVLLPALFGRLRAERLLLAVADHTDSTRRHSCRHQRILGGVGAVFAQSQVVLVRSALVAVTADHDLDVRMAG